MANSEAKLAGNRRYSATTRKLLHTRIQIPKTLHQQLKQQAEMAQKSMIAYLQELLDNHAITHQNENE